MAESCHLENRAKFNSAKTTLILVVMELSYRYFSVETTVVFHIWACQYSNVVGQNRKVYITCVTHTHAG